MMSLYFVSADELICFSLLKNGMGQNAPISPEQMAVEKRSAGKLF
jgi:hypothetical protein